MATESSEKYGKNLFVCDCKISALRINPIYNCLRIIIHGDSQFAFPATNDKGQRTDLEEPWQYDRLYNFPSRY